MGYSSLPFPCTNLVLNTQSENKQHQYNSNLWRSCFIACVTQRPIVTPWESIHLFRTLARLHVLVPSSSFLLQRCPDCFCLKINASFFPYRLTTFLPWFSYTQGREKCLPAALLFTIHLFLPHLYRNFSHGLLKIERKVVKEKGDIFYSEREYFHVTASFLILNYMSCFKLVCPSCLFS